MGRKQELVARRPPIPKKMQTDAKMQAYFFPGSKEAERRTEGFAKMTQSFTSPVHSELAILTSGATKVMSSVTKSEQKPTNLWSESILPDLSVSSKARSLSRSRTDQPNKCDYKCLSDSLLQ